MPVFGKKNFNLFSEEVPKQKQRKHAGYSDMF